MTDFKPQNNVNVVVFSEQNTKQEETVDHFQYILKEPLMLQTATAFSCCVKYLTLNLSIFNLLQSEHYFQLSIDGGVTFVNVNLPNDYFCHTFSTFKELFDKATPPNLKPYYSFSEANSLFKINLNGSVMILSEQLKQMLGFTSLLLEETENEATFPYNFFMDFTTLYLVAPSLVCARPDFPSIIAVLSLNDKQFQTSTFLSHTFLEENWVSVYPNILKHYEIYLLNARYQRINLSSDAYLNHCMTFQQRFML